MPGRRKEMIMLLILLLFVLLLALAPAWPYSKGWGYYPSGTLGAVFTGGDRIGVVGTPLPLIAETVNEGAVTLFR
jgi:hypothetical protein